MPENSILISTKKKLGLDQAYEQFDMEIISYINSALAILTQLGVGPEDGLNIDGPNNTWDELFVDSKKIELAKSYIYLKVRLLFDPPTSSFVLESMNKQLSEYEWRINVMAEKEST